MAKKKNKSRLTKTDVNKICEMQRTIDAYEDYIDTLFVHSGQNTDIQNVCLLKGTAKDDEVQSIYANIQSLKDAAFLSKTKENE